MITVIALTVCATVLVITGVLFVVLGLFFSQRACLRLSLVSALCGLVAWICAQQRNYDIGSVIITGAALVLCFWYLTIAAAAGEN